MRPLFWWSDSDTHNIFFSSNLMVLHILWRLHWKKNNYRTQATGRRFLFCRGFANKLLRILGMSFCEILRVKTHLFRGLRGVIKEGSGASRGPGSRLLEDYHSFLLVPTETKKNSGSVQDQGCLQVVTSLRILQLQVCKKISQKIQRWTKTFRFVYKLFITKSTLLKDT